MRFGTHIHFLCFILKLKIWGMGYYNYCGWWLWHGVWRLGFGLSTEITYGTSMDNEEWFVL